MKKTVKQRTTIIIIRMPLIGHAPWLPDGRQTTSSKNLIQYGKHGYIPMLLKLSTTTVQTVINYYRNQRKRILVKKNKTVTSNTRGLCTTAVSGGVALVHTKGTTSQESKNILITIYYFC